MLKLFFLNFLLKAKGENKKGRKYNNYPWKQLNEKTGIYASENQLFLYGFPYYRGWDKTRDWVKERGGIRSYYTNDNVTIAEYYLEGIDVYKPHPEQMPQFYFLVENSQEFGGEEVGNVNVIKIKDL